ncbi:MAG: nicotinate (nicotinamide) nucleotide adenylyltransferase [Eubacteriales bacterium]|nr:nicotinate (nicotinamide) nucleotide adenylyltransferase [Eubacteriales bacterium]
MADKIKTGIFGGAFNPIHNGHLNLAKKYLEVLNLDRIIFIPTALPPHKTDRFLASKEDRFNMLELAISDCDRLEISDIEFQRQGKSYTYDTLRLLREKYPNDDFYLIIGADQFLTFNLWYRYRDILDIASICTAARENGNQREKIIDFSNKLDGLDKNRFHLLNSDAVEVSSSQVREKIKKGEDVSSLIPEKVYNYIVEKGLYSV